MPGWSRSSAPGMRPLAFGSTSHGFAPLSAGRQHERRSLLVPGGRRRSDPPQLVTRVTSRPDRVRPIETAIRVADVTPVREPALHVYDVPERA